MVPDQPSACTQMTRVFIMPIRSQPFCVRGVAVEAPHQLRFATFPDGFCAHKLSHVECFVSMPPESFDTWHNMTCQHLLASVLSWRVCVTFERARRFVPPKNRVARALAAYGMRLGGVTHVFGTFATRLVVQCIAQAVGRPVASTGAHVFPRRGVFAAAHHGIMPDSRYEESVCVTVCVWGGGVDWGGRGLLRDQLRQGGNQPSHRA